LILDVGGDVLAANGAESLIADEFFVGVAMGQDS